MNRNDQLIHMFNARGHAFLTLDHQGARIKELEAENAKLKELLKECSRRLIEKLEIVKTGNRAFRN